MLLMNSICVENDLKFIPFAKLVAKGLAKKIYAGCIVVC